MPNRRIAAGSGALTAHDWMKAAAVAIDAGGISAVAVEPLARKLRVTKGSFYWHFTNRDALLAATLAWWEAECTDAVIAAVEQIPDPRARLATLFQEATRDRQADRRRPSTRALLSNAFELAVSDAAEDPIVRPVLQRVAKRRIDYLEECYRSLGYVKSEARHWALLAYASYVGTLRLTRDVPDRVPAGAGYRAYQRHLIATLVPGED